MKMMFVISKMQFGGAERVMANLTNYFAENGHEITLVSAYDYQSVYPLNKNIKTVFSPRHQSGKNQVSRMLGFIHDLCHIIDENRPDVVVSFLTDINIMVIPACKIRHVPVIVSERNDPKRNPTNKIKRFLRKLLYRFSDGYVFQTEEAKSYFSKNIQGKSAVIPNPLLSKKIPQKYGGKMELQFVSVGRLEPQKNQKLLIDAFAKVVEKHPDAMLHIYGEGGLRDDLTRQIQDLGLQQYVILEGTSSDVLTDIHKAYAFILTSDFEGMPNSLLEAMACGLACIATDCSCGGCKMLIHHMDNGMLVPVGRQDKLVEAIEFLIENGQARESMAINALRVRDDYSGEKINALWMEYIKHVVKG